ncbi:chitin deacetylase 7 [Condylostylus longicornis]|uniref:chitin deacetylase 7 n=1 Tax=Condylostylus longicornis TaxID=2530218 RepID=UPI00244DB5D6|nr:chitin deacetylase 7 [Condylostylus longicornis]
MKILFLNIVILSVALGAPSTTETNRIDREPSSNFGTTDFNQTNFQVHRDNLNLPLAEACDPTKCTPPKCRCSQTFLSKELPPEKIPQLVAITYDDAVTALNYEYIQSAIRKLKNPDGCKALATFFVSHEYTDYTKVHKLWEQGHEIALHSISHKPMTTYWNTADVELLKEEFGGQRDMMAHFAQIKKEDIKGIRTPLFEISANTTYFALKEMGLTYDSSWPTQHFTHPGMWPYTLDYQSTQDCPLARCPTASIPGVWVSPLLDWTDVVGNKCAMLDACGNLPEDDVDELFKWMMENFEQNYKNNRAPFPIYLHASFFLKGDNYLPAYKKFLEHLNTLPDVYFVTVSQIIDYVKAPTPDKPSKTCVQREKSNCKPRFCQLKKTETQEERWMKTCVACPSVYPWVGNPFGKPVKKRN